MGEKFAGVARFIFPFRVRLTELAVGVALSEPPAELSQLFVWAVVSGEILCSARAVSCFGSRRTCVAFFVGVWLSDFFWGFCASFFVWAVATVGMLC